MIRPPTYYCRNLLAALMEWSNLAHRVIVMAATHIQSAWVINALMREDERERPFDDVVSCPILVVFTRRLELKSAGLYNTFPAPDRKVPSSSEILQPICKLSLTNTM